MDGKRCAEYYLVDDFNNEHLAATARKAGCRTGKALVCVPTPGFDAKIPLASCIMARQDGIKLWMKQVEQLQNCSGVR